LQHVDDFYSVNEINKPAENRVYHNNSECHSGREIPQNDRVSGAPTGYRLCEHCISLNRQGLLGNFFLSRSNTSAQARARLKV